MTEAPMKPVKIRQISKDARKLATADACLRRWLADNVGSFRAGIVRELLKGGECVRGPLGKSDAYSHHAALYRLFNRLGFTLSMRYDSFAMSCRWVFSGKEVRKAPRESEAST